MNSLELRQTDGASQVKAGDFGSRFAFQLLDEQGKVMTDLDGQVATVQLVSNDQISFETTARVEGGEVAFRFNKLVSPGRHWLEIWVGGYIFPSDRKTRLEVIRAARERQELVEGAAGDLAVLPPIRDLLGNPVSKVILHDLVVEHNNVAYPKTVHLLLPEGASIHPSQGWKWVAHAFAAEGYVLLSLSADRYSEAERVSELSVQTDKGAFPLAIEVVQHAFPQPPALETSTIVLNAANQYRAQLPLGIEGLTHAEVRQSTYWPYLETGASGLYGPEPTVTLSYHETPRESLEQVVTLRLERQHHVAELALTVRVEAPEADAPEAGIPLAGVPEADVPLADVPLADVPEADVPLADVPEAVVPEAGEDVTLSEAEVPADDVRPSPHPIRLAKSEIFLEKTSFFNDYIEISGWEGLVERVEDIRASVPHLTNLHTKIIGGEDGYPIPSVMIHLDTPNEELLTENQTFFTTLYLEHGEYRDAYPLTVHYIA